MKDTGITMFQCEVCGDTGTRDSILIHEPECRERDKVRREKAKARLRGKAERQAYRLKWARASKGVRLLLGAGFDSDAVMLCERWVHKYGQRNMCDAYLEDIVIDMVEAAREAASNDDHE